MIERLPYYYRKSKVVNIRLADQRLFITTTDEFTLHEKDVSLAKSDGLDDETRRARVIARLQGSRVLTVEALKELVALYEKSGVEINELYDKYAFTLEFVNREGVPENITEIISAIEEVKPAHLRIGLSFIRDSENAVALVGAIQKQKNIAFNAEDAIWRKNITASPLIGGRVQKLKTINLEVSDG